ncbi:hypothetical protein BY996DRAFT_6418540 [Phakopsora pachyrhizi]|nr:hypothetical protein BY996DRAFT_6418540 [Phakopsora pachyrhizi]
MSWLGDFSDLRNTPKPPQPPQAGNQIIKCPSLICWPLMSTCGIEQTLKACIRLRGCFGNVVSFLGDSKLRTRELACSALCAIASLAFEYHCKVNQLNFSSNNSNLQKSDEALAEIERIVKDQALANKVARARAQRWGQGWYKVTVNCS